MSNNIQAAWAAFKLDNGRKSTVNMWCDSVPFHAPFHLGTDPWHTPSYCSLGFPVLCSTVCRVVNQLTLRPQRGDYGLRPRTPPLHDTTVTTTQADSYPVSAWPLQYAIEIKHTHDIPLATFDPRANIEKWKVFSSSWFMPQILIIYCPRKCTLPTCMYCTWYVRVCSQPLRGGQWVIRVLVQPLVLVMLLMDFLFPLNCTDWELCHNLRKPFECLYVPPTFCVPIRWWPQVGSVLEML